jgi:hypothetical protein
MPRILGFTAGPVLDWFTVTVAVGVIAKPAVTVLLALIVTLQVTVVVVVQPVHEEKVLLPDIAGAVSMIEVPAL